jgi:hypothetical protein
MDQKFLTCYNKHGIWNCNLSLLTHDKTLLWLNKQKINDNNKTTILPFNNIYAPRWFKSIYCFYKINSVFFIKFEKNE